MTDRPIIFSAPMVRALLEGRKTQTRRIIKKPAAMNALAIFGPNFLTLPGNRDLLSFSVFAGDRLWVREAHAILPRTAYRCSVGTGTIDQREHPTDGYSAAVFREGFDRSGAPRWRPSIHMPRWASRLTLIVTDVRVQRLQEISHDDAVAEGMGIFPHSMSAQKRFREVWNSLHGNDAWDANPWVLAISFRTINANINSTEATA